MGRSTVKQVRWKKRQSRVRRRILGTPERPRLAVRRSLRHIYVQVVDDTQGKVLAAISSLTPALRSQVAKGGDRKAAAVVGTHIAQVALAKGIQKVVFDRRGYRYHGRVKALAEAARTGGLQF